MTGARMNRGSASSSRPKSFPPPVRGWVDDGDPNPRPGGASVLENFMPTPTGLRLRGGSQTLSTLPSPGVSMFAYNNGVTEKLFTASSSAIYDSTLRDGSPATVAMAGQTSGDYSTVQFSTAGKTYLYAVNGSDAPILFDGTAWQKVTAGSTPISITSATGPFSYVWSFKSRLFFVRKNTMEVAYLPTGLAGGAAQEINLAGVFQNGGRILFGTTWSSDSGAGFGDRCVIVTDTGETAIFEGDDPSDVARWRLVSRYELAPPLGMHAHTRAGGDVLIATTAGLIPLSVAGRDGMALATAAISRPISNAWRMGVEADRSNWSVMRWDGAGVILVTRPTKTRDTWAVNVETGAWFKIVGWDVRRAVMHKTRLHFLGSEGVVRQGDTTGQDDGVSYVGRYRGQLERSPAGLKVVRLYRAMFRGLSAARYSLRFVTGDKTEFGSVSDPWPVMDMSGRWDVGLWDVMTWDSGVADLFTIETNWRAEGTSGQKLAVEVQVVSDDQQAPVCEYLGCEAMIEMGGLVV